MMKKKTDSIRQEDRSRYLLITFMSIVFFGVGISSKYLIVHSFCTVACKSRSYQLNSVASFKGHIFNIFLKSYCLISSYLI